MLRSGLGWREKLPGFYRWPVSRVDDRDAARRQQRYGGRIPRHLFADTQYFKITFIALVNSSNECGLTI